MRNSKATQTSSSTVPPTPNLTIMVHHYNRAEYLFRTVTMYPEDEREQVLDDIVSTRCWYGGRYAPGHRERYLETRLFVEDRMRETFARKYWPPRDPYPAFFYLNPQLSISVIEERLHEREQFGEPNTRYLLLDLMDLSDTTHVSFTLCDSHTSYREALIQQGLSSKEPANALPDHGMIFHIHEVAEVYERHKDEDDLYFEVQVWNQEILAQWKDSHDIQ